jgi:CheY-like chemotaxis protein
MTKKAKILIADDDPDFLEMYKLELQRGGFEVITAETSEKCLVMALEQKPDLILLDIMMPKISGFEILESLKTTPETKNIPVVMITALGEEHKKEATKLGARHYIQKSQITPLQLTEKLKKTILH